MVDRKRFRQALMPAALAALAVLPALSAELPAPALDEKKPLVKCVDPHACCSESEKVIETLRAMVDALNQGDLAAYESYLDEHCTTVDESSKRHVVGRQAVMADLRRKVEELSPTGPTPLLSYTIDHPYAKVHGDTAVVNFVAIKEIGGKHPYKMRCKAFDIFVKHGNEWKKSYFRGRWEKVH